MSKGAKAVRTLSKELMPRTQQVTVVPTPFTFSERYSVLRALQKYAEIDVFKKIEGSGHTSSFITVTRTNSAAEELIRQSPLQYQLETASPNGVVRTIAHTSPKDHDGPGALPETPADDEAHRSIADEAPGQPDLKSFTVHVFPLPEYKHAADTRRSLLHDAWPDRRENTIMRAALKKSLPDDVARDGLSDWESGDQSLDIKRSQMIKDLVLGHQSMDPGVRGVHTRRRQRKAKQDVPAVTDGLLHLRSDGQTESPV